MLPNFTKEERVGLSYFVKLVQQSRLMVSGMLVTNVAAAIFEGGTIGILAVAMSVLAGGGIIGLSETTKFPSVNFTLSAIIVAFLLIFFQYSLEQILLILHHALLNL